jgi:DNA polymerase-4
MTEHMINSANGIDESQVTPKKTKNQSISTTETLSYDTTDEDKLKEVLFRQTQDVAHQLRNQNQYAKTVAIIYKDSNFVSYSQQEKLSRETNNTKDIYSKVIEIFEKSYKQEPIRLIGVRLSDLTTTRKIQISLFEEESEQDEEDSFQKTLDAINNKFGKDLVAPASLKAITKRTEK